MHNPSLVTEPLATSLRRGAPLVWSTPASPTGGRRAYLGWGERLRLEAHGPHRFRDLAEGFRAHAAENPGVRAFVSVTFSPDSEATSVLIVPEVQGVWEDGVLTVDGEPPAPTPEPTAEELELLSGTLTREGFRRAVADAVHRIRRGEAAKIVIARDLLAAGSAEIDLPGVLTRLEAANQSSMIFHVDGMFGASPELLVRRDDRRVVSRVLAGSTPATGDTDADDAAAEALLASPKNVEEHAYAVQSVVERLSTVAELSVEPTRILRLTTIQHLATDISGDLVDGAALDALDLAELVHPSAAICGTPTDVAARMIAELEGFDRGRYAGPVGWIDAAGNGDFAIALRCGQLADDARSVRLYAGGGIVADSVPSDELAETAQKFLPVYQALSPVARP